MSYTFRMLVVFATISTLASRLAAQESGKGKAEEGKEICYEDIVELTGKPGVKSIEALLPNLPLELRGRFVLMTQSKSSHQATTYYPRVILCSPTARLMMAYSTDKNDTNRQVLEVIQWRDDTDRFEFREIAFDPQGRAAPKFSEANPSRCTTCHGESLRPNWEPARRWPGALGQGTNWEDKEIERHELLAKRNDSRLSALEWRLPEIRSETPSAKMARHTNTLNMRRFARFLRESEDYDEYKFAIVAGLVGLPEFLRIEPIRSLQGEQPSEHRERLLETKRVVGAFSQPVINVGWHSGPTFSPHAEAEAIAALRTIFEPRKISLRDLNTSFHNPMFMTGSMKSDFGEVLHNLYSLDAELRSEAPLPSSGVVALLQRGQERTEWAEQLIKAAARKDLQRRHRIAHAAAQ